MFVVTSYKQNDYKGHNGKVSKYSEQFAKEALITSAYIIAMLPLGSLWGKYNTVTILSPDWQNPQFDCGWRNVDEGVGPGTHTHKGGSIYWLQPFLQQLAIIY